MVQQIRKSVHAPHLTLLTQSCACRIPHVWPEQKLRARLLSTRDVSVSSMHDGHGKCFASPENATPRLLQKHLHAVECPCTPVASEVRFLSVARGSKERTCICDDHLLSHAMDSSTTSGKLGSIPPTPKNLTAPCVLRGVKSMETLKHQCITTLLLGWKMVNLVARCLCPEAVCS